MNHWLLKTEPSSFSIDDLQSARKQTTCWDGVRNFQARNFLKAMRRGDQAFLYHSSCEAPGVMGVMSIEREAYPDLTAFDSLHEHYDPQSKRDEPRWFMVDVRLVKRFSHPVTLEAMKQHLKGELKDMIVLKRGNRLSITPVTESEWRFITALASRSSR